MEWDTMLTGGNKPDEINTLFHDPRILTRGQYTSRITELWRFTVCSDPNPSTRSNCSRAKSRARVGRKTCRWQDP